MPLRTRCFLAGSIHFCKTVRLDFGFCLDSAGLVSGNCFSARAAGRTESLEPQVTTFWYHKVLQAPAKCFHRRRTNLRRHLLQCLGKTRTGMFHAGPCHTMPSSDGALPDRSESTNAGQSQIFRTSWRNVLSAHLYWPSPCLTGPTPPLELSSPHACQPSLPLQWAGLLSIC